MSENFSRTFVYTPFGEDHGLRVYVHERFGWSVQDGPKFRSDVAPRLQLRRRLRSLRADMLRLKPVIVFLDDALLRWLHLGDADAQQDAVRRICRIVMDCQDAEQSYCVFTGAARSMVRGAGRFRTKGTY